MTASQTPEAVETAIAFCQNLRDYADKMGGRCENPHGRNYYAQQFAAMEAAIRALSAPVSGEAVAWRCRLSPNGDWFDLEPQYVERRIADGLEVQALGVLAARSAPPAGEGVEALREALTELLTACEADFGVPDEHDEDDEPVGAGENSEMAIKFGHLRRARSILSTLSGGLGSRPAAQAVPGGDGAIAAGHRP